MTEEARAAVQGQEFDAVTEDAIKHGAARRLIEAPVSDRWWPVTLRIVYSLLGFAIGALTTVVMLRG